MTTHVADYGALLAKHGVTVERPEPIPPEWLPLLDNTLGQLVELGWRHRRLKQVKEKFGSLRIYVDHEDEPRRFLELALATTRAAREARRD